MTFPARRQSRQGHQKISRRGAQAATASRASTPCHIRHAHAMVDRHYRTCSISWRYFVEIGRYAVASGHATGRASPYLQIESVRDGGAPRRHARRRRALYIPARRQSRHFGLMIICSRRTQRQPAFYTSILTGIISAESDAMPRARNARLLAMPPLAGTGSPDTAAGLCHFRFIAEWPPFSLRRLRAPGATKCNG